MSGKVVGWAFEVDVEPKLSPLERFVLVSLADNADISGLCWPHQETTAERTGLGLRTVRTHIATLQERDLLSREAQMKVTGRGRASDLYRLNVPWDQPANDARPTGKRRHDQPANDDIALHKEPSTRTVKGTVSRFSPEVERLCRLLEAQVNAVAETPDKERVTDTWRTDVDRLIRIDGRTPDQVRWIIGWLGRDEEAPRFWAANVQSGKKLREKFDQLVARAKLVAKKNGPSGDDLRARAARERAEGR